MTLRSGRSKVVIVDDSPMFRHAARLLLERRGYDIVGEASCAASALEAVERRAPHAVLLDVHLGDDNGFEVCGLLRRSHPDLIVVLTSAEDQDPDQVTRCGARGFLHKSRVLRSDFGEFCPSEQP